MQHLSAWRRTGLGVFAVALAVVVASCGSGAADKPRIVGEPWQFGGEVPEAITVPMPIDGEVISSLSLPDRTVVMAAYPGSRLAEVVAFYDVELEGPETVRSEHTIIAETEAVWMVRWRLTDFEVRVVECIDVLTRDFTQVCVAIDQHPTTAA